MLLGDEEGVVKAITHLPPEAGTMGGDPASYLLMHDSNNVIFQFEFCISKKFNILMKFLTVDPLF